MKNSSRLKLQYTARQAARAGTVIVETAIVLPIFLLILLGIIEFGRAMMVQQVVTTAARDACRKASLRGSTNSDVEAEVEQFLNDSVGVAAADVTVTFSIVGAPGSGTNGTEISTADQNDIVTVQVEVPYSAVSFGVATHLSAAVLHSSIAMRHE